MAVTLYDYLPDDAVSIRREVFMTEQGFINEFDDIDDRATHAVLYRHNRAVGTCRFFTDGDHWVIGRVAVLADDRGNHDGVRLLAAAEDDIACRGGTQVHLSSQVAAAPFYERVGYVRHGDVYLDEHCEHIAMVKTLTN